jgi:DNA repair protein RadC
MNNVNQIGELKLQYIPLPFKGAKVYQSDMVYKYLIDNCYDKIDIHLTESFYALYLNMNGDIVGWYRISSGGIASCVVDIRMVFQKALLCPKCTSIILSHNHPSNNLKPSNQDKSLTTKICQGAEILQFKILDHIIVTPDNGYYSFADDGII